MKAIEYPVPQKTDLEKLFEKIGKDELVYVFPLYQGVFFTVFQNTVTARDKPLDPETQKQIPRIDSSRFQFFYVHTGEKLVLLDVFDHETGRFLIPEEFSLFTALETVVVPAWEKRPVGEVFGEGVHGLLKRFKTGCVIKKYGEELLVFSIVPTPPPVKKDKE